MVEIEFDNQILKLTNDFYNDYPRNDYPEILRKKQRPYNCLLVETHYDYFICVPYRTDINHDYAFKFSSSSRSASHNSGLDYTKIIIVRNLDYVDSIDALVDQDEYHETMINLKKISEEATRFVEDYVAYQKGELSLHPAEVRRRYNYTTLKYFHSELGING